ncbi:amino acid/polyamine transporter I [Syncephalis pseudoplumigaleata]|uniref:Amino acid/polyamine transporter I n=1 Tax=Syncephalis pseudoplumigaleata TaxID=1712513 RepID=A0A4P9Z0L8_9FUNG|nr:amino acid/polyamine transporter I [Syncephalis pseudoplumigaleata]|eukprot:RKP25838.1 amino acid/polyamine transporter I [Syncephalis pseudoplumigaleata]
MIKQELQGGVEGGAVDGRDDVLPRTMGVVAATALVIGHVIGSGIFSTPAIVWSLVGSPGMSLSMWLIGGVITICGAVCFVELGTLLPNSGGEQAYLAYIYRRPYVLASYLFFWSLIIFMRPASAAANAVVAGKHLLYALFGPPSQPRDGAEWTQHEWLQRAIGLICIACISFMTAVSTRWTLGIQTVFTIAKMLVLLLIATAGVLVMAGGIRLEHPPDNWREPFAGTSAEVSDYASAMFKISWAYSGWNNIHYALGELKHPQRNLPLAAFGGMAIVIGLYLLANFAYMAVVPASLAFHSGEVLAASFCSILFGEHVGQRMIAPIIGLSALGSTIASVFAASRVLRVAAQDGYLPGSSVLARLHPGLGTPVPAVVFNMCLAFVMLLAPPPGKAFSFLVDFIGYPSGFFLALTVAGMLRLRHTEPGTSRPFRAWTPVAYFYITIAVFVCVFPWVPPKTPPAPGTIPHYLAPLLGVASVLTGLPMWYVMLVHRGSARLAWHHLKARLLRTPQVVARVPAA